VWDIINEWGFGDLLRDLEERRIYQKLTTRVLMLSSEGERFEERGESGEEEVGGLKEGGSCGTMS